MLASERLLSNSTGRAEQISPDPIMLKRYTDGLNRFQCKESITWHILTSMWIINCILTEIFFDVFLFVLDNEAETAAAFFPVQSFLPFAHASVQWCVQPISVRLGEPLSRQKRPQAHTMGCARVARQLNPLTLLNVSDILKKLYLINVTPL